MKCNIDENEENFQKALEDYLEKPSMLDKANAAERMYECIFTACTNLALSIYKKRGFSVAGTDIVDEIATEATLVCLRNIEERGHKPAKLSAYCYLRVLSEVNKREDSHTRLCREILERNSSLINSNRETVVV